MTFTTILQLEGELTKGDRLFLLAGMWNIYYEDSTSVLNSKMINREK